MPFTQKGATETLFLYERSHNITASASPYISTSQKLTKPKNEVLSFIEDISEKDSVTIAINNIDDITNLFGLLGNIEEEQQKTKSKDKLNFILSESVKESFYKNFPLNLGFIPNVYFLSDKDIEQEEELKKLQDREKWYNSNNKVEIASQLILTNHQSDIADDEKVKILTLIQTELPDDFGDIEVSAASFDNIAKELATEAGKSENLIDDKRSLKDKVVAFYQEFNSAFVKKKLEANFSEFLTVAGKKEYPGLHISASYSWNEKGKLEITIKDIKSGGLGHYAGFQVNDKLTLNSFINQEQPDKLDINALRYIIENVRKGQLQGLKVERIGKTLQIAPFQEKIDKIYSADPRTKVGKEVRGIIFGTSNPVSKYNDIGSKFNKLAQNIDSEKVELERSIRSKRGAEKIKELIQQVGNLNTKAEKELPVAEGRDISSINKGLADLKNLSSCGIEHKGRHLNSMYNSLRRFNDDKNDLKDLITDLANNLGYKLNDKNTFVKNAENKTIVDQSEREQKIQSIKTKLEEIIQKKAEVIITKVKESQQQYIRQAIEALKQEGSGRLDTLEQRLQNIEEGYNFREEGLQTQTDNEKYQEKLDNLKTEVINNIKRDLQALNETLSREVATSKSQLRDEVLKMTNEKSGLNKAQILKLQKEFYALRKELPSSGQTETSDLRQISQLEDQFAIINQIGRRLEGLEGRVGTFEDRSQELSDQISGFKETYITKEEFQTLSAELKQLQQNLQSQILAEANKSIRDLENKYETRNGELLANITAISKTQENQATTLEELKLALDAAITQNQQSNPDLLKQLQEIRYTIDIKETKQEEKINNLEQQLTELSGKVDNRSNLDAKLSELEEKINYRGFITQQDFDNNKAEFEQQKNKLKEEILTTLKKQDTTTKEELSQKVEALIVANKADLDQKLAQFSSGNAQKFQDIREKIKTVNQFQTRLEELEEKVTSVNALQAEMSSLKETFITQEQFQQLQSQQEALKDSLISQMRAELEGKLAEQSQSNNSQNQELLAQFQGLLKDKMDRQDVTTLIETEKVSFSNKIKDQAAIIEGLSSQLQTLERKVVNIENIPEEFSTLHTEFSTTLSKVSEFGVKLEGLKQIEGYYSALFQRNITLAQELRQKLSELQNLQENIVQKPDPVLSESSTQNAVSSKKSDDIPEFITNNIELTNEEKIFADILIKTANITPEEIQEAQEKLTGYNLPDNLPTNEGNVIPKRLYPLYLCYERKEENAPERLILQNFSFSQKTDNLTKLKEELHEISIANTQDSARLPGAVDQQVTPNGNNTLLTDDYKKLQTILNQGNFNILDLFKQKHSDQEGLSQEGVGKISAIATSVVKSDMLDVRKEDAVERIIGNIIGNTSFHLQETREDQSIQTRVTEQIQGKAPYVQNACMSLATYLEPQQEAKEKDVTKNGPDTPIASEAIDIDKLNSIIKKNILQELKPFMKEDVYNRLYSSLSDKLSELIEQRYPATQETEQEKIQSIVSDLTKDLVSTEKLAELKSTIQSTLTHSAQELKKVDQISKLESEILGLKGQMDNLSTQQEEFIEYLQSKLTANATNQEQIKQLKSELEQVKKKLSELNSVAINDPTFVDKKPPSPRNPESPDSKDQKIFDLSSKTYGNKKVAILRNISADEKGYRLQNTYFKLDTKGIELIEIICSLISVNSALIEKFCGNRGVNNRGEKSAFAYLLQGSVYSSKTKDSVIEVNSPITLNECSQFDFRKRLCEYHIDEKIYDSAKLITSLDKVLSTFKLAKTGGAKSSSSNTNQQSNGCFTIKIKHEDLLPALCAKYNFDLDSPVDSTGYGQQSSTAKDILDLTSKSFSRNKLYQPNTSVTNSAAVSQSADCSR